MQQRPRKGAAAGYEKASPARRHFRIQWGCFDTPVTVSRLTVTESKPALYQARRPAQCLRELALTGVFCARFSALPWALKKNVWAG